MVLRLRGSYGCQRNRRARLAIDFSTDWACVSHASDVLGVCVMITSALLRTETERWREECTISRPARSYRWVLGKLGMITSEQADIDPWYRSSAYDHGVQLLVALCQRFHTHNQLHRLWRVEEVVARRSWTMSIHPVSSIHTDEHKQPGRSAKGSGQLRRGGRDVFTYTPVRCTFMRYTPMRCTPVRYMPMRYTP
jgi:hypothetical protein